MLIQYHQHTRRSQTEQVSHLWKEPMTHDRRTVSNFGKEAQAQDRGTDIAAVPVDCIIGSAWTFFHWNYRALASQDSQQWLTTTTPPTLQPNTPLSQLAWEGQYGRKLRPSFTCTWQYILWQLVIISNGTTATPVLLLLLKVLKPQVEEAINHIVQGDHMFICKVI